MMIEAIFDTGGSLNELEDYLNERMDASQSASSNQDGRIGGPVVRMERNGSRGIFQLRENDLEVESHSNFVSVKANVCVFRGRWMFEITLGTSGIQQLGWVPPACMFTEEEGVGDMPDSYAYDGSRVKRWNQACHTYGEKWAANDVIGCCLDLETAEITYYRNGKSLGVAFASIQTGVEGLAYFPALSLSFGERSMLNFGSLPFEFPIEGFRPLQEPPPLDHQGKYLADCLGRVLPFRSSNSSSPPEDVILCVAHIVKHLAPLLQTRYHVASCLYPLLVRCDDVNAIVEILEMLMEDFELRSCMSDLFSFVAYKCRTISFLDQVGPTFVQPLTIAVRLLRRRSLLLQFVRHHSFTSLLEAMLATKQPSDSDLVALFPTASIDTLADRSEWIVQEVVALRETALADLIDVFLRDDALLPDSDDTAEDEPIPERGSSPLNKRCSTPQAVFLQWISYLLSKNRGLVRNVPPSGLSDSSVLCNVYFTLLSRCRDILDSSPADFPVALFHRKTPGDYHFEFPRVGGALSHLQKQFPIQDDDDRNGSRIVSVDAYLVDSVIILYHLAMSQVWHKQFVFNLHQLQQSMAEKKTQAATDQLRQSLWFKASLSMRPKQDLIWKMVVFLLRLIDYLSSHRDGLVFHYLPEFYITSTVDAFHVLKKGNPPFPLENPGLTLAIEFFVRRYHDTRIVNPATREDLLQSLQSVLQDSSLVRAFEASEVARNELIQSLLASFESSYSNANVWIPITMILLRFWRWTGFAQARPDAPSDGASIVFRSVFRSVCRHDDLYPPFLNRVFNHLNWAASEFLASVREIGTNLPRIRATTPRAADTMYTLRKIPVTFELATNLLRLIEIIAMELPESFLHNELNQSRLIELVVFWTGRTASSNYSRSFADVVAEVDASLSHSSDRIVGMNIDRLIGPVVGILANLLDAQQAPGATPSISLADSIAEAPAFDFSAFEYVASYPWNHDEFSPASIRKLATFKSLVEALRSKSSSSLESSNSDLCSICYAADIDTVILPCMHSCCHKCITRHLANSNKCFYCNAVVTGTQPSSPSNAAPPRFDSVD